MYNKAFSMFNKCIGSAKGFAQNHAFPAMRSDFLALKAGMSAGRAGTTGRFGFNARAGMEGFMGAPVYRPDTNLWGVGGRFAGYGVAAGMATRGITNMWGITNRDNTRTMGRARDLRDLRGALSDPRY